MALGFKFFHSGQVGAPVLTGQVGKLIDLLDWALDISDATLGWEKVFSGTNAAAYRPRYGLRPYLDVDDTGGITGAALAAKARCYEDMTGLSTGTLPFPLVSTLSEPNWRKSNTADATVRRYYGIKTAEMLLLYIESVSTGLGGVYMCGQVPSLHPAEAYPFLLAGNPAGTWGGVDQAYSGLVSYNTGFVGWGGEAMSGAAGASWMRNPSGAIKAVGAGIRIAHQSKYDISDGTEVALVRADVSFIDLATAATAFQKPRSYIPNLWTTSADLVAAAWAIGDTFTIPEYNPAATFMWVGHSRAHIILETTDTGGAV